MPFEIVRNDITRMRVDAVVNAANPTLLGGGGVDGAIHRAAGPQLLAECRTLGGCATGQAKITKGYDLPCRYVIHTVGPVWQGGGKNEKELLASCYAASLALAAEHGCESVAFPLISAGAYGYPKDEALKVATDVIRDFLFTHDMTVYLVVFDRTAFSISKKLYAHIQAFIDDAYVAPRYEEAERRRREINLMAPSYGASESIMAPAARPPREKKGKAVLPADSAKKDAGLPGASLEDYLDRLDEGFRDMLLRKIDESGMTDAECYKKANVDRKLFNKIKNQPEYRPGKSTVLAFAVALRLPLPETEDMLRRAGFSLSHSSKFDLIVEFFISRGEYDIYQINEALFSFDQKLLGSVM
ncbi:MAG: O-acetyl-ADP-ribose deacetylase [Clostridiales bacterium]|nr:O-acetyl-ADP-ribose deacetylase [Clostridiales bacterium]